MIQLASIPVGKQLGPKTEGPHDLKYLLLSSLLPLGMIIGCASHLHLSNALRDQQQIGGDRSHAHGVQERSSSEAAAPGGSEANVTKIRRYEPKTQASQTGCRNEANNDIRLESKP